MLHKLAHDTASDLVTALPDSTAKTALEERSDSGQTTIDDAQDALDAVLQQRHR